jgi:hypothetical protein
VLANTEASKATTLQLLRLQCLKVSDLERVESLAKHLLWKKDLSLG